MEIRFNNKEGCDRNGQLQIISRNIPIIGSPILGMMRLIFLIKHRVFLLKSYDRLLFYPFLVVIACLFEIPCKESFEKKDAIVS